jgi:PAS domain S-box-containing protein
LQVADVNREVEKGLGYSKEELIQTEFLDLFGPEEREGGRLF